MSRDEFSLPTKRDLAQRAAHKCSICRAPTAGPAESTESTVNIGEAAHIEGASNGVGAKRFNSNMTSEQRRHIRNGIWLCRNCHGLIDRDVHKFPKDELHRLKRIAEESASNEIGIPPSDHANNNVINNIFNASIYDSNLNLGNGAQHIELVNHREKATTSFYRKDFTEAKRQFKYAIKLGADDEYSNILFVISSISERHVSYIKTSEINRFYIILQKIKDNSNKALANLIWLILFHEFSSSKSPSRQMESEEKKRRNYFFDSANILSKEHKQLVKNIVLYSDEAKCLLM